MVGKSQVVLVNAEELLGQDSFLHPIIPIKSSLGSPAEVKGRKYVGIGPVEIFQHFRPVIHLFVGHFSTGAPVMIKPSYRLSLISSKVR